MVLSVDITRGTSLHRAALTGTVRYARVTHPPHPTLSLSLYPREVYVLYVGAKAEDRSMGE